MKTLYPVDEETYSRLGKAFLICAQYPEVFGDIPCKKFCAMFVDDIIDEDEDERAARMRAAAPKMYELLRTVFGGTISFTEILKLGDYARELLARIDGKEVDDDE